MMLGMLSKWLREQMQFGQCMRERVSLVHISHLEPVEVLKEGAVEHCFTLLVLLRRQIHSERAQLLASEKDDLAVTPPHRLFAQITDTETGAMLGSVVTCVGEDAEGAHTAEVCRSDSMPRRY